MEIPTRLIIVISVVIIVLLAWIFIPVGLWFSAKVSGVKITINELIFMKWRKVPPELSVNSMISLTKEGVV